MNYVNQSFKLRHKGHLHFSTPSFVILYQQSLQTV